MFLSLTVCVAGGKPTKCVIASAVVLFGLALCIAPAFAADEVTPTMGGTGTAFVVHPDGYLVTNAHVIQLEKGENIHVEEFAIAVTLSGKSYPARIVKLDVPNDLAILKINARGLPALPLADSKKVELASEAWAFGYPLSPFLGESLKVTRGTVSGLPDKYPWFQTDTPVNSGNSGGPLIDGHGRVVGVVNAKMKWNLNLPDGVLPEVTPTDVAWAIPINEAKKHLEAEEIEFGTESSAQELEGTALAKKVGPSVAFVRVEPTVWSQSSGSEKIWNYSISADERLIAIRSRSLLSITELATGKHFRSFDWANTCVFSPVDNVFAVLSGDRMRLYDVPSFRLLFQTNKTPSHGFRKPIVFSYVGSKLAVRLSETDERLETRRESVGIWDLKTQKLERRLNHNLRSVADISFSPNGRLLAAVGIGKGLRVWDMRSGQSVNEQEVVGGGVLAFSPDSSILITKSALLMASAWNTKDFAKLYDLRVNHKASFSHDGEVVAVWNGGNHVWLHDARTGTIVGKVVFPGSVKSFQGFLPHSNVVGSVMGDGSIAFVRVDARSRSMIPVLQGPDVRTPSVAYSPDGRLLAVGTSVSKTPKKTADILVWDVGSRSLIHQLGDHNDYVSAIVFSPDGRTLASAGKVVRLWNVQKGAQQQIPRFPNPVDIAFSPDGKSLGIATPGGVRLLDIANQKILPVDEDIVPPNPPANSFYARLIHSLDCDPQFGGHVHGCGRSVAWSPDGSIVVGGGRCGFRKAEASTISPFGVIAWDAKTRKIKWSSFEKNEGQLKSLAFHPNGNSIAAAFTLSLQPKRTSEVRILDAITGKLIHNLQADDAWIERVVYSPDGTKLLAGSSSPRIILIFDPKSGKKLERRIPGDVLEKNNALAFSPDGKVLAVGHSMGRVSLYSVVPELPDEAIKTKMTPEGWRELTSVEGGFKVLLPGRPVHATLPDVEGNTVQGFEGFSTETGDMFAVMHFYRFGKAVDRYKEWLVGRKETLEKAGEQVQSLTTFSWRGFPAVEVHSTKNTEGSSARFVTRAIFTNNRMFTLTVNSHRHAPDAANVQKFFGSFRLLEK